MSICCVQKSSGLRCFGSDDFSGCEYFENPCYKSLLVNETSLLSEISKSFCTVEISSAPPPTLIRDNTEQVTYLKYNELYGKYATPKSSLAARQTDRLKKKKKKDIFSEKGGTMVVQKQDFWKKLCFQGLNLFYILVYKCNPAKFFSL